MSDPNLIEQTSLAKAFADRTDFFTNRASAIFPVFLRANTDLRIVFLNYWHLKNSIAQVQFNLRIYDAQGQLVHRSTQRVQDRHNDISMKKVLGRVDFEGMVEAEFISADNLRFSFPAIVGLYTANDCFSAVHAAGRVRNPDEAGKDGYSIETNWTCKFAPNITPYFHIFNGPHENAMGDIHVTLHAPDQRIIQEQTIAAPIKQPFSSRIIFADELFDIKDPKKIPQDSYLCVKMSVKDVFPRMIVGNYFRDNHFMEFTHTFPVQHTADYVQVPEGVKPPDVRSFMPVFQAEGLDSEIVSFPTNCEATVQADILEAHAGEPLHPTGRHVSWKTGGPKAAMFKFRPEPNIPLTIFNFSGDVIPSRLNANYVFRVQGINTAYTTDIASGAKSYVYPPKRTHWGVSVFGGDVDAIIFFRNVAHRKGQSRAEGTLKIFATDQREYERFIMIEPEECLLVRLSEFLPAEDFATPTSVSWFVQLSETTAEAFWVSYAPDGRIAGCHGF